MFYKKMLKNRDKSQLVFRLDISLPIKLTEDQDSLTELAFQLCGDVKDYVSAIAIDSPFFIAVGPVNAEKIIRKFKVPFIADFNLAETEPASLWIAEHAFNAGFDALVVHSFMGRDYVQKLKEFSGSNEIIPILGMSHDSSRDFINPSSDRMCDIVKYLKMKTAIVPSDVKQVSRMRECLGDVLLFADSESGSIGDYVRAGADFEMVGRSIHNSKDPEETALRLMNDLRNSK